jgi:hypothetical protein
LENFADYNPSIVAREPNRGGPAPGRNDMPVAKRAHIRAQPCALLLTTMTDTHPKLVITPRTAAATQQRVLTQPTACTIF